jgi:hypothetical protein
MDGIIVGGWQQGQDVEIDDELRGLGFKPGTLTKLSNNPNAVRTTETDGIYKRPPTVGESFMFVAPPLEVREGTRLISTSLVVSVEIVDNYTLLFDTENSRYQLTMRDNNGIRN